MEDDHKRKIWRESGSWFMKRCTNTHGSSYWREIMLHKGFLEEQISYNVGDGKKVKFCLNRWITNEALAKNIPLLIGAVHSNDLKVNQVVQWKNNGFVWDMLPRRHLIDLEIMEAGELCELLKEVWLSDEVDIRIWEKDVHFFQQIGCRTF